MMLSDSSSVVPLSIGSAPASPSRQRSYSMAHWARGAEVAPLSGPAPNFPAPNPQPPASIRCTVLLRIETRSTAQLTSLAPRLALKGGKHQPLP